MLGTIGSDDEPRFTCIVAGLFAAPDPGTGGVANALTYIPNWRQGPVTCSPKGRPNLKGPSHSEGACRGAEPLERAPRTLRLRTRRVSYRADPQDTKRRLTHVHEILAS